jgi:hypothetical protein
MLNWPDHAVQSATLDIPIENEAASGVVKVITSTTAPQSKAR